MTLPCCWRVRLKAAGALPSDLQQIRDTFKTLAKNHDQTQDLYIYLIGHGSHLNGISKFQIPGTDLSAGELNTMITKVPARRVITIVATSSGAGFINALSGPGRITCSATKSTREINATQYIASFIESLESGGADRNRDERISVAETCRQAASLTEAWYLANGLIATEHAILDDNGDGLGTRLYADPNRPEQQHLPDTANPDGALAAKTFLKDLTFPPSVPQTLVDDYLATIGKVEKLIDKKASMKRDAYYRRLETDLLKAARLHREIRRLAGR